MTGEETLLQAVLDRPGDEGALDALASFFEAQDDPRGEVLRRVVDDARGGSRGPVRELCERLPGFFDAVRSLWVPERKRLSDIDWYAVAVGFVSSELVQRHALAERLAQGVAIATVYQSVHDADTWLGDEGARKLAADPNAACLRSLDVERHRIGPAGVRALCESPYLSGLVELKLSGNPIGDGGMEALASSTHLRRLEVLDLKQCGVSAQGLRRFLASPNARRLMALDVTDGYVPWVPANQVPKLGLEGVQVLAAADLPRLRDLLLGEQYIQAEGAAALASSPLLRQLRRLDVSQNGLGAEGLKALAASPHLPPRLTLGTKTNHVDGGEWRQYTDWDGSVQSEGWEDVSARESELAKQGIVFPPGVRLV